MALSFLHQGTSHPRANRKDRYEIKALLERKEEGTITAYCEMVYDLPEPCADIEEIDKSDAKIMWLTQARNETMI